MTVFISRILLEIQCKNVIVIIIVKFLEIFIENITINSEATATSMEVMRSSYLLSYFSPTHFFIFKDRPIRKIDQKLSTACDIS